MRVIASTFLLFRTHGLPINPHIFNYFYSCSYREQCFCLQSRQNCRLFGDIPSSHKGWKNRFVYISLPSIPNCPVGFLPSLPPQPSLPRSYKLEEAYLRSKELLGEEKFMTSILLTEENMLHHGLRVLPVDPEDRVIEGYHEGSPQPGTSLMNPAFYLSPFEHVVADVLSCAGSEQMDRRQVFQERAAAQRASRAAAAKARREAARRTRVPDRGPRVIEVAQLSDSGGSSPETLGELRRKKRASSPAVSGLQGSVPPRVEPGGSSRAPSGAGDHAGTSRDAPSLLEGCLRPWSAIDFLTQLKGSFPTETREAIQQLPVQNRLSCAAGYSVLGAQLLWSVVEDAAKSIADSRAEFEAMAQRQQATEEELARVREENAPRELQIVALREGKSALHRQLADQGRAMEALELQLEEAQVRAAEAEAELEVLRKAAAAEKDDFRASKEFKAAVLDKSFDLFQMGFDLCREQIEEAGWIPDDREDVPDFEKAVSMLPPEEEETAVGPSQSVPPVPPAPRDPSPSAADPIDID